jgi:FemAB-related protein (PEP-CTERM system-associated)
MNIELQKQPELWDAYVESAAPDSPYHRWVWREIVEETFGHEPHYLAAVERDKICGVLPLVSMRSHLFGNFLVSIPFFSYGGVIADSDEAREKLLASAAELGRELGARHIELRQGDECPMPWQSSTSKVTMEIHLPATADEAWKRLSSGMRNKIRNGQKQNFHVEWSGIEAIPTFYGIWSKNMRNLGTPAYPRRFFENQIRRLPDRIRILTLWDGETAVASSFINRYRDRFELPWSGSLLESRKKYSQVLMYWTFIQKAMEEGVRAIDLGRCTRGSGVYEFKRHWSPVERPLHWYYWLAPGAALPHFRPDNPKFKMAVELWKRLPLAVANGLGPRVVRSIP